MSRNASISTWSFAYRVNGSYSRTSCTLWWRFTLQSFTLQMLETSSACHGTYTHSTRAASAQSCVLHTEPSRIHSTSSKTFPNKILKQIPLNFLAHFCTVPCDCGKPFNVGHVEMNFQRKKNLKVLFMMGKLPRTLLQATLQEATKHMVDAHFSAHSFLCSDSLRRPFLALQLFPECSQTFQTNWGAKQRQLKLELVFPLSFHLPYRLKYNEGD